MEIFEQAFRELLIGFNLVGSSVYLMRAPQVANRQQPVPYVVFLPVGALPHVTHNGPLDIIERDYQVSIFDRSQSRALAIADGYQARLNTLRGVVQSYQIVSCLFGTQTENWEQENEMAQIIQQYRVMFKSLAHPELYPAVNTVVKTATGV